MNIQKTMENPDGIGSAWERGRPARMSSCDKHEIINEHKTMENPDGDNGCYLLCGRDARAPRQSRKVLLL